MNDLPPGIAGYVASQQQNQQQTMGNVQLANLLEQFQQRAQANQKEQAYRAALSQAQTPEDQEKVAIQFGGPEAVMKSMDRKATIAASREGQQATLEQRRQAAEDRLGQQTQYANMMHEWRMAQAKTAEEKAAADAAYRAQVLGFQQQNAQTMAELRRMGLTIQQQGQALQQERQAQQQREAEEKAIEGQIGKTADRMKDVQPVWTAAQQLNAIMTRYTPENIPGIGYLKNTDVGKIALSQEGKDVSSSAKLLGNSILKAMSGSAVTAPEEIRQMAAMMADGRFSSQDFYTAWPKISEWVNDQVKLSTAGLTPKARERFIERTGLKLDPLKPRFTFDGKKLVDTQAPAQPQVDLPPPPPGFQIN